MESSGAKMLFEHENEDADIRAGVQIELTAERLTS